MVRMHHQDIKEKIVKKSVDDPKRDKRRCVYFQNGSCEINTKCYGSSHCEFYREYYHMKVNEEVCDDRDTLYSLLENGERYFDNKNTSINLNSTNKNHNESNEYLKGGHITIKTTEQKYKGLLEKCLSGEVCVIDLFLTGADSFQNFDNYQFGAFYLLVNDILIQCGTSLDSVEIIKSGSIITIHIPIIRFHIKENVSLSKKCVWQSRDDFFGEVLFRVNKKKIKKRKL